MTVPERDDGSLLRLNVVSVRTELIGDFLASDERRPTSFVTNFGDWPLPDDVAAVLGNRSGHLEWFHDTGELVLIGGIPEPGVTVEEVPTLDTPAEDAEVAIDTVADVLAGPLGAPGMVYRNPAGGVRETVLGSTVSSETRVAVLAVVEHGPQTHALLWGWHREHRRPEGWQWLLNRLDRAD